MFKSIILLFFILNCYHCYKQQASSSDYGGSGGVQSQTIGLPKPQAIIHLPDNVYAHKLTSTIKLDHEQLSNYLSSINYLPDTIHKHAQLLAQLNPEDIKQYGQSIGSNQLPLISLTVPDKNSDYSSGDAQMKLTQDEYSAPQQKDSYSQEQPQSNSEYGQQDSYSQSAAPQQQQQQEYAQPKQQGYSQPPPSPMKKNCNKHSSYSQQQNSGYGQQPQQQNSGYGQQNSGYSQQPQQSSGYSQQPQQSSDYGQQPQQQNSGYGQQPQQNSQEQYGGNSHENNNSYEDNKSQGEYQSGGQMENNNYDSGNSYYSGNSNGYEQQGGNSYEQQGGGNSYEQQQGGQSYSNNNNNNQDYGKSNNEGSEYEQGGNNYESSPFDYNFVQDILAHVMQQLEQLQIDPENLNAYGKVEESNDGGYQSNNGGSGYESNSNNQGSQGGYESNSNNQGIQLVDKPEGAQEINYGYSINHGTYEQPSSSSNGYESSYTSSSTTSQATQYSANEPAVVLDNKIPINQVDSKDQSTVTYQMPTLNIEMPKKQIEHIMKAISGKKGSSQPIMIKANQFKLPSGLNLGKIKSIAFISGSKLKGLNQLSYLNTHQLLGSNLNNLNNYKLISSMSKKEETNYEPSSSPRFLSAYGYEGVATSVPSSQLYGSSSNKKSIILPLRSRKRLGRTSTLQAASSNIKKTIISAVSKSKKAAAKAVQKKL